MAHFANTVPKDTYAHRRLGQIGWWAAIVTLVLVGFYWMAEDPATTQSGESASIDRVFPAANELDLRQVRVGVDLTNRAIFKQLQIDNTIIPDDQLEKNTGLNQVTFRANADHEITSFSPGRHCAVLTFATVEQQTTGATQTRTWCFNLH